MYFHKFKTYPTSTNGHHKVTNMYSPASNNVKAKSGEDFRELIRNHNYKATFVYFTAQWCGPCKMFGPIFDEYSKTHKKILFVRVDVDNEALSKVVSECGVSTMPTIQVFRKGYKVDELLQAKDSTFRHLIDKHNK